MTPFLLAVGDIPSPVNLHRQGLSSEAFQMPSGEIVDSQSFWTPRRSPRNAHEGTSRVEEAEERTQPVARAGEDPDPGRGTVGRGTVGSNARGGRAGENSPGIGRTAKGGKRNGGKGSGGKKGKRRQAGGACPRGAKHAAAVLHAAQDRAERLQRRRAGFEEHGLEVESDDEDREIQEGAHEAPSLDRQDPAYSMASSRPEPEDQVLGLDGRLFLLGLTEVGKNICLASSPSTASAVSSNPFKIFHTLLPGSDIRMAATLSTSFPSLKISSTSDPNACPSIDSLAPLVALAKLCDDSDISEALAQLSYFINTMQFACQTQRYECCISHITFNRFPGRLDTLKRPVERRLPFSKR